MRIALFFILSFIFSPIGAQDYFGEAQWIGAITYKDAKIPEGRLCSGNVIKETKAAWDKADPLSRRSIVLRRSFKPYKTVKHAELRICGLGFYEATINGQKVGDSEFAPSWSDYDKTVFFNVYDVTQQIRQGDNELRVLLGNGFYNEQGGRYTKLKVSFGPPTLLYFLYLTYDDGMRERVYSDEKWQWTESPITFNSIYGGEDYDARLEVGSLMSDVRADQWKPVVIQEGPEGRLRPQIAHSTKVMERYPAKQTLRKDSILVIDMGQNLAGYPEITVRGNAGERLKLTPGETLDKNGLVDQRQTGRPHYYTYILKGSLQAEIWHPRFSYYGYRYLQIEGDIDVLKKVESCFVYNSAERIGSFECSNPRINATHQIIDRAIRSNWQAVWTDCPSREKLGWLEQDWLNGEGLVSNYDCRSFIEQTMQNIADAQQPSGALPEIAPNLCVFEGSWAPPFLESPEWGGAFIALPFLYRDYYGDDSLLRQYRQQMERYTDYLATQDSAYILRQGLGDWYDFGPGRAGFAQNTPMPLVSTAHYYWWNKLMGAPRADSIRTAFIREFYHPDTHQFGTGSQCANAIALEMGLVPDGDREAVVQNLIDDIRRHGNRLTTGDVGNRYLFNALIHNGQQELLYQMLNHYDVPGYGYQIKLGHTTLTEQWNPEHGASMNHFMMGHLNNLLIPYFLGIWRHGEHVEIAPHPVGDLTWCRGSTGDIRVAWYIKQARLTLDVDIPQGCTADVTMPYSHTVHHVGAGHHTWSEQVMTTKQ